MSVLAFDIETVMRPDLGTYPIDVKWRENMPDSTVPFRPGEPHHASWGCPPALHPATCQVVQVSFGWHDKDGRIQTAPLQWDDFGDPESRPETSLLIAVLERLSGAIVKKTVLISFNGKQFDLWVIRIRSRILGLSDYGSIPWAWLLHPYDDRGHVDLRLLLGNGNRYARGTLQSWADAFGVDAEERGGEVQQMVCDGRWEDLRRYGHAEARTLIELYDSVMP